MQQKRAKRAKTSASFLRNLRIITRLGKFFKRKKIVIITEKGIKSIPLSSKLQASILISISGLIFWFSYTTGVYFAHENIISKKDRQIWNTNLTNEELKHQVIDLHQNLSQINKYFDVIKEFKQSTKNNLTEKKENAIGGGGELEELPVDSRIKEDEARKILNNIHGKILQRTKGIETVIKLTGLKLKDFGSYDYDLKELIKKRSDQPAMGGPLIPLEDVFINQEIMNDDIFYLTKLENALHKLPLLVPMKDARRTSRYGKRVDPFTKRFSMHNGMDFVDSLNAEIFATAPGIVKYARRYGAYGKFIEIDHGNGITTRYGHLNKISVKKGQRVERGQKIGHQGSTGRSTGPHLHYEVRFRNKPMDPHNFLKAGNYVF